MKKTNDEDTVLEKPKSHNDKLGLSGFNYRKLTGEDFERYQAIVKKLDHRTSYDWVQYKAVGVWNKYKDPITGQNKWGTVLVGIELVDVEPINYTRMEARHLETWATDRSGDEHMGGMNAQIYNKENNRANSRYYLLRLPEGTEATNA